jgi:phosphotriesterase-related protein
MKKLPFILLLSILTIKAYSQPALDWNGKVMTVRGLISPDSMGITLPHEHLIIVHKYNYLDLTDENIAIEELGYFTGSGGKTVADASAIGIGRNPEKLKTISTATNTNVIMCTGYYKDLWIPDSIKNKSIEELTDIIINDIFNGINGIHAGFIKIGISKPITAFEEKAVRAAARAQKITGAAVELHFDGDRATFAERNYVLDVIENEGADLHRVIMDHCVPYVYWVNDYISMANRGCYIAFDMTGLEVRVGFIDVLRLPETLNALINAGYIDHLLISQDVCFSVCYVRNGGYGYGHILNNILPQLRANGITDAQIHNIMVDNPKQVFPFKSTADAGGCVTATYTASSGTITDNSGESDYTYNLTCSKLIQPENSTSVTLIFNSFSTEAGNDIVSIYDGPTTSSPLLGRYSGNSIPPAITSSGNSMLVVFSTNGSVGGPGWSASYFGNPSPDYTGTCVNEVSIAESGTITDNSGVSDYYANMSCQKLIKVQDASSITLNFNSFATEAGYDFVRVYDGETTSSPLLGEFSGSSIPPTVTSSGNSMLITFTTDGGVQLAGWSATYTATVLKVNPAILNIGASAGTTTFSVHSTLDWSTGEDAPWLIAVKTNDSILTVSYNENFSLQARSATISVTADGISPVDIQLNQTGATPFLTASPESAVVECDTGSIRLNVESNIGWSVSDTASWLSSSKINDTTVLVRFEQNKAITERSAGITLSGPGVESQIVSVVQQAAPPLLLVIPDTQRVACDSGKFNFKVQSNFEWFVSGGTPWVYAEKSNDSTILIDIEENLNVISRSALLSVGAEGIAIVTVIVSQDGTIPVLTVDSESPSVSAESGSSDFAVSSNIDWNVDENEDWIAALKLNDTTFTVIFQANPDTALRTAEISLSGEGVDTVTVIVIQDGAVIDAVNPAEIGTPLVVFPNPVSGTVWFNYSKGYDQFFEIYDPSGKIVLKLNDEDKDGTSEIDLSGLNPGIYIYRVIGGEGSVVSGKIVKK